jgi:hypothetical protein
MDPRDGLRPTLEDVACTACGAGVPADRLRILARRDDLTFVGSRCDACGSDTVALLTAAVEPDGRPFLDVATDRPSPDGTSSAGPITSADVHAMRADLAVWRGDLRRLLGAR